jgi:hypothetical protein
MKVNVILSGSFGEQPEIREVHIDEQGKSTNHILEEAFTNGQNMFAEDPTTRSLSIGDMIELYKEYYIIADIGFIKEGEPKRGNQLMLELMLKQENCNELIKDKFNYLLQ